MKVPYKPMYLPKGPNKYRYIVIHDCNCQCKLMHRFKIDNVVAQTNEMRSILRQEKNYYELPFHFVCEKIKEDYETLVARPLQYSCEREYPDIDSKFAKRSIHICVMGNFNVMSEDSRMYQQICYRAITPLMKQYRIPRGSIYLHGELSKDNIDCPGFSFSKQKLLGYMSTFMIAQAN